MSFVGAEEEGEGQGQGEGQGEGEDRISKLPDDLIHHILSFTNTKLAVQTCILSKRWQHIWATLPHLNLDSWSWNCAKFSQFLTRFFSCRNHQFEISTVNLYSAVSLSLDLTQMIVSYAIAHNVQNLSIVLIFPARCRMPLSIFRHKSLKKLIILEVFPKSPPPLRGGLCWWLPALTVLHISGCDLPESFINLPALITLHLGDCNLPKSFSSLPALTTLHLKNVRIYEDKSMYFSELVNLKNLTLAECKIQLKVLNVSSRQLTNLTIKNLWGCYRSVISAPKLSAFNHYGVFTGYVFPLTLTSLHKVNLEMIRWYFKPADQHEVAVKLIGLLQEFQSAKFLTINGDIIEALSEVPDLLDQRSPLKSLKFLKVKEDHKFLCSTIPSHVRTYLLSGSPSAAIVKEFPKIYATSLPHTLGLRHGPYSYGRQQWGY